MRVYSLSGLKPSKNQLNRKCYGYIIDDSRVIENQRTGTT